MVNEDAFAPRVSRLDVDRIDREAIEVRMEKRIALDRAMGGFPRPNVGPRQKPQRRHGKASLPP